MPRYVVSYIDWFDYEPTTLIISASDPMDALRQHPKVAEFEIDYAKPIEDVKKQFFDCDAMGEVVEIP